jgi:periplasmic divalent cation tolerance protein
MTIVSVYATFADAEEAERIGRQVLDERLAACVNILGPSRSIYRWQGTVEHADEIAAIFKTTAGKANGLVTRIADLHSYDLPAVAVWPIDKLSEGYGEWVEQSVKTVGVL